MKGTLVAGLLIVAILIGAGVGYLTRGSNPQATTSTVTISTTSTTGETNTETTTTTSYWTSIFSTSYPFKPNASTPYAATLSSHDLRLELSLNSSSVRLGGGILVTMNLTNAETQTNNVYASRSYPRGLEWPNPCQGYYIIPIGIAVFSGYVTDSNVTSSPTLNLTEAGGSIECPGTPNFNYYSFQPSSNLAMLCSDTCIPWSVTIESTWGLAGSWTGNGTVYTKFPAGLYTVVEGDEWGDLLLLYFTIS
jgi:hypothetical protein